MILYVCMHLHRGIKTGQEKYLTTFFVFSPNQVLFQVVLGWKILRLFLTTSWTAVTRQPVLPAPLGTAGPVPNRLMALAVLIGPQVQPSPLLPSLPLPGTSPGFLGSGEWEFYCAERSVLPEKPEMKWIKVKAKSCKLNAWKALDLQSLGDVLFRQLFPF